MGIKGTGVRTAIRRGKRVIIVDFHYTDNNGVRRRYRRDADVQTMASARAEADRLQKIAVETGSPVGVSRSFYTFPPLERVPAMQGVYFIHLEPWPDIIKIGYAKDIERRIFHLDQVMPAPICLLAFKAGGTLEDEAAYHRRFARMRVRGEWFRLTCGLAQLISELREQETA